MRPQPLIAVRDVEASSRWYEQLLGCEGSHGGPEYQRLTFRGELIMQLHNFEAEHDHGPIADVNAKPYGNGVLLWFETDDFDAAVARAEALNAQIVLPPHVNPRPNHREVWLRDPDGYLVVLASPDGEAADKG